MGLEYAHIRKPRKNRTHGAFHLSEEGELETLQRMAPVTWVGVVTLVNEAISL